MAKKITFRKNERKVIAFSGGSDSVYLALKFGNPKKDVLVHINHNIRKTAKRDEEFAVSFAKRYGFKVIVLQVFPKFATEEECRDLRYEALIKTAKELKVKQILTGHNLNDTIETTIFNMFRGTSINGLSGIGNIIRDGIEIFRPIGQVTKTEIKCHLISVGQEWVEDETNQANDYTRNEIRNELIPVIRNIFPNFEQTFNKTITSLNETNDYIEKRSESHIKKIRQANNELYLPYSLLTEDNIVIGRVLSKCFDMLGVGRKSVNRENMLLLINGLKDNSEVNIGQLRLNGLFVKKV